ncbi:MAG TPA: 50S ribosomal protein L25 [Acidimicrobiales bacterium]|nr:50S ribosomal protein L25 [Acidimicrobiales bacterium]
MAELALKAETGRTKGSRASRRLRAEGKIPCVVYGHGIDPLSVAVNRRELRGVLTTEAGMNALVDLGVDGQQHLTVVRDVHRHPVRHEVIHLDFVIVRRDEVISVEVPIVLTGSAEDVRREAGTVDQVLFNLPVMGRPGSFPNELEIDISNLRIGDSVRIDDLVLPNGVTTELDGEEPVVVAQLSRASLEADELEAEAVAEGNTGEESAGTE